MTIENLTAFLGWCTLINLGFMLLATVAMVALKKPIHNIHGKFRA